MLFQPLNPAEKQGLGNGVLRRHPDFAFTVGPLSLYCFAGVVQASQNGFGLCHKGDALRSEIKGGAVTVNQPGTQPLFQGFNTAAERRLRNMALQCCGGKTL